MSLRPLGIFAAALLLAACADRQPASTPAATPPAPASSKASEPTCRTDLDCTDGWHPQMPSCGTLDRCIAGRCGPPAAMTGEPNAETGRLVFEVRDTERAYGIELVDDRFEIARGLMCRQTMHRDWGMLFLMESTKVQSFWMKNTLMPLDMVFLDANWAVVGVVADAQPRTLSPRTVGKPSRYVLELVAGEAARVGIEAGTQARFYAPRPTE